jgi:hypothetical protein
MNMNYKFCFNILGVGKECNTNGGEEECIWNIGGKARRKETTGKIKA